VQNDLTRTITLFEACDYITEILARYASIEAHYGNPVIDDWDKLQDVIVDVYAAVLRYTLKVKSAFQEGTTSSAAHPAHHQ
jgi:hypothetical protein